MGFSKKGRWKKTRYKDDEREFLDRRFNNEDHANARKKDQHQKSTDCLLPIASQLRQATPEYMYVCIDILSPAAHLQDCRIFEIIY